MREASKTKTLEEYNVGMYLIFKAMTMVSILLTSSHTSAATYQNLKTMEKTKMEMNTQKMK